LKDRERSMKTTGESGAPKHTQGSKHEASDYLALHFIVGAQGRKYAKSLNIVGKEGVGCKNSRF
jgi:hypothetical protein